MLYFIARGLQLLGLILLPVAMGLQLQGMSLRSMLVMAGTGIALFYLGYQLQQRFAQ